MGPVAGSGATLPPTTRAVDPLLMSVANLRLDEPRMDIWRLDALLAATGRRNKAIMEGFPRIALLHGALRLPGKGRQPGCTCPRRASGAAGNTPPLRMMGTPRGGGRTRPRIVIKSMTVHRLRMATVALLATYPRTRMVDPGPPRMAWCPIWRLGQFEGGLTFNCSRLGPVNSVQGATQCNRTAGSSLPNTRRSAFRWATTPNVSRRSGRESATLTPLRSLPLPSAWRH